MDWLTDIPAQFQGIAGFVFAAVVAGGGALAYLRGKKEGPPNPKVQEFYASGQIADMGPVKELVEQTGLLVQQQIRTAIALEANAVALTSIEVLIREALQAWKHREDDRDREEEIERRARQRAEDLVREQEEAKEGRRRRPSGSAP